jgi:hypothetical protein
VSLDSFTGDTEKVSISTTHGERSLPAAASSLILLPPLPGFSDSRSVKGLDEPWKKFPMPCQNALQEARHAEIELGTKIAELEAGNITAYNLPKVSMKRRRVDQANKGPQSPRTVNSAEQTQKREISENAPTATVKESKIAKRLQGGKGRRGKSERRQSTAVKVRDTCLRCWVYREKVFFKPYKN